MIKTASLIMTILSRVIGRMMTNPESTLDAKTCLRPKHQPDESKTEKETLSDGNSLRILIRGSGHVMGCSYDH